MSKRVLAFVVVLLVVGNLGLLYQNLTLKKRSSAVEAAARKSSIGLSQAERAIRALELVGLCAPQGRQPAGEAAEATAAEAPGGLAVHLYFSLTADCISCIQAEVDKLNELVAGNGNGRTVHVRGFTEMDDPRARRTVDRDLQPVFPVHHVDDLTGILAAVGVPRTPVLMVVDETTGRNLAAHFPDDYDTQDRSFLERLQRLQKGCS